MHNRDFTLFTIRTFAFCGKLSDDKIKHPLDLKHRKLVNIFFTLRLFVPAFGHFDENDILPMFSKYNITTFYAPPTMLRMLIRGDLSKFDLSSIHHMTTAGEALNPEVFKQFKAATGLEIMEGFGQTETTLAIANLYGTTP